jgi:uncharacterized protein (TIGR01777 family)
MSKLVVSGATGTIGSAFVRAAREQGHLVIALARDPDAAQAKLGRDVAVHEWRSPEAQAPPAAALRGADAVVHLLGEPIDQRWTAAAKQRIRDSRVRSTEHLVAALAALPDVERPRALVSQSATGYYGAYGDGPATEDTPRGHDFLAGVVAEWEQAASSAEPLLRVVRTRTGVVLSPQGGALSKMLPFFRLGVGGPVAGGRQYVPWVHLDDVVAVMLRCVEDDTVHGPVNVTAPNAATNAELSKALGAVLRRPAVLPVPALALKALYGEMGQVVTTGRLVVPQRLQELGYPFRHPELEPALRAALGA